MAMRIIDRLQGGEGGPKGRDLDELKRRLHQMVLDRIDVGAVAALTREQVRTRLRDIVENLVQKEGINLAPTERDVVVTSILDEITGLGPLEGILADPSISDILVNGPNTIYIERNGRLERVDAHFRDDAHLVNTITRIVGRVGRRVDESSPMVDARLADGSRVNAIIAPLALDGAALSIRRFGATPLGAKDLVAKGALSADMMNYLKAAVRSKCNVLISGGTGAGKTTLLNALVKEIPDTERIIVIEDTPEVRLDRPNAVGLIAVKGELGEARIGIDALMQASLRMRPDRLLVGEIRGGEAFTFLRAINTGHPGSITTIHADSPRGALEQLAFMALQAGLNLSRSEIIAYAGETIDIIVQLARRDGKRVVSAVTLTRDV